MLTRELVGGELSERKRERPNQHSINISLLHRQEMAQDMHIKFTSKSNNSRELTRDIMKQSQDYRLHFYLENRNT